MDKPAQAKQHCSSLIVHLNYARNECFSSKKNERTFSVTRGVCLIHCNPCQVYSVSKSCARIICEFSKAQMLMPQDMRWQAASENHDKSAQKLLPPLANKYALAQQSI